MAGIRMKVLLLVALPLLVIAIAATALLTSGTAGYALGLAQSALSGFVGVAAASSVAAEPGATPTAAQEAERVELPVEPGILVAGVLPEGAAAAAGVVRGDIVLTVDGTEVNDPMALHQALEGKAEGDVVALRVRHGDDLRELTATLGAEPGLFALGLIPAATTLGFVAGGPGHADVHIVRGGPVSIGEVVAESPAAQAGLQVGDEIVAADGEALGPDRSLADVVGGKTPGDTLTLQVKQPGEAAREVTVTLGQHPDDATRAWLGVRFGAAIVVSLERMGVPGMGEMPFTMPLHGEALPDDAERALIVHQVVPESAAATAGLKEGTQITAINGERVSGPEALTEAVAAAAPGDTLTLTVKDGEADAPRDVTVTLGAKADDASAAFLGVEVGFIVKIIREFPGEPGAGEEDTFQFFPAPAPGLSGPNGDVFQIFPAPAPGAAAPDGNFLLPAPAPGSELPDVRIFRHGAGESGIEDHLREMPVPLAGPDSEV